MSIGTWHTHTKKKLNDSVPYTLSISIFLFPISFVIRLQVVNCKKIIRPLRDGWGIIKDTINRLKQSCLSPGGHIG